MRLTHILLPALLWAVHGAMAADAAFVPPDVRAGGASASAFQVEFEGIDSLMQTQPMFEDFRVRCEILGRPFVSEVPDEEWGTSRRVVVQGDGFSYDWSEVIVAKPDPKVPMACHFRRHAVRQLTVSRFDGRRTHTTHYDYGSRTYGTNVRRGDHTFFSPEDATRTASMLPAPTGQRVVAGIPCMEYRTERGPFGFPGTVCLTRRQPFAGREGIVQLAEHWTSKNKRFVSRHEATRVTPRVQVDMAVLDGPPGFQPMEASPAGEDHDTGGDDAAGALPAKRQRGRP